MLKNKKVLVVGTILILLVVAAVVFRLNSNKEKIAEEGAENEILPQVELIPTVDDSVKVALTTQNGKEVFLTVDQIPANTTGIEYELSYLAQGGLPKGVIGAIEIDGEDQIKRKITLGTCSSGRCVYDQGVTKIKVSLKFTGNYGNRLFDKEFEI